MPTGSKQRTQKVERSAPRVLREDRPQPHDIDSEKAVLAAVILEAQPCMDVAIEKLGGEEAFYSPAHRAIFKCVNELYNEKDIGIDLISVSNYLARKGILEDIGGNAYLAEIQNSIASTANIEAWTEIVHQYSMLRGMINVCAESMQKCYDSDADVEELLDSVESNIYDVRYRHVKPEIKELRYHITETFKNVQKIIQGDEEVGIPTQFPELDKLTFGLKPGEMFVLAARPSIGKTSLALNFLRNIALKPNREGNLRPVAFFSLEMTAEQITRRLLCTEAGISESMFYDKAARSKIDMTRLTQAVQTYKNAKIFIDPTGGLTLADLRAKARRLKTMHNIELIAIDYLQLMKVGSSVESRQQEVAEISSGLKKLAKDLDIPILVLAQLNREIEKSASAKTRPKLSHLRESGAIEQDADIVAFLHRDREESKLDGASAREVMKNGLDAEIIVEKNRNGQTGIVNVKFYPHVMEFRSSSRFGESDRPSMDSEK